MIDIMDSLHKYVPKKTTSSVLRVGNEEFPIVDEKIHQILFGGDQKTAARARGSIIIRSNSNTDSTKLLGLYPVIEDWHGKVIFLQVHS